jgi:hypothetical protein
MFLGYLLDFGEVYLIVRKMMCDKAGRLGRLSRIYESILDHEVPSPGPGNCIGQLYRIITCQRFLQKARFAPQPALFSLIVIDIEVG